MPETSPDNIALGPPTEDVAGVSHHSAEQILRVFTDAYEAMGARNQRVSTTRDVRRGTLMVGLNQKWSARFQTAAPFVQSLLPERRTLERSVKATVRAVGPEFERSATGDTADDDTAAEWVAFYLNELKKRLFPFKATSGKGVEDGEYAVVVVPDAATLDGAPLYCDTVTAARYKTLKPAERKKYKPYGEPRKGADPKRYVKLDGTWSDGKDKEARNPEYDRDERGRRRDDRYYTRPKDGRKPPPFKRDEDRSAAAFDEAQRRYRAAHLPIAALVLPALDVAPIQVRSKDDSEWTLVSMVTRTRLKREEAIRQGYTWKGMGDRLLVPQGRDAQQGAQHGMMDLLQMYTVEKDDDGVDHPLILSCIVGIDGQTRAEDASQSNVHVLDLYDEWGICEPLWDYCGGMSTSDDDAAFAYEPWLWPFVNRILKIEGLETVTDMGMWENANTGYLQIPSPEHDNDVLLDSAENLRVTKIPEPGEVVVSTGPVQPFAEQRVNPDFRYREQALRESLREQTASDAQAGGNAGDSGHKLVVEHTLSVVAKDDIRSGVLRAARLFARASLLILDALSRKGIDWPIETTEDRPIGGKQIGKGSLIEFDRDWLGGSFEVTAFYPSEANPVEVSLAEQAWVNGSGTWEDLQKAKGKNDSESERRKVAEDDFWKQDYGKALLNLEVARIRRDKMAEQIAQLQAEKALAAFGLPGMEAGVPMGLLGGGGQQQPQQVQAAGVPGVTPQQLVGSVVGSNSGAGPIANDARAVAQIAPEGGVPMMGGV